LEAIQMYIFLSYASEDHDQIALVEALLTSRHHRVFFDRNVLPAGEEYHQRIATAVAECDRFVFFVSAASITPGSYCLTELELARRRWLRPTGCVLPVLLPAPVQPVGPAVGAALPAVDVGQFPPYLSTLTGLRPIGNLAVSVVDAVERLPGCTNGLRLSLGSVGRLLLGVWKTLLAALLLGIALAFVLGVGAGRMLSTSEMIGISVVSVPLVVAWAAIRRRWLRRAGVGTRPGRASG
jgi:TIR domain